MAKPLLVFLNARGRNLPWTFACIEEEFFIAERTLPCKDEVFCNGITVMFSKDVDPKAYGRIIRDRNPEGPYRANENWFEMCARSSVQILHIQVFILDFLILCSQEILHEIPEEKFFDFPIQEAPSPSNVLEDDGC